MIILNAAFGFYNINKIRSPKTILNYWKPNQLNPLWVEMVLHPHQINLLHTLTLFIVNVTLALTPNLSRLFLFLFFLWVVMGQFWSDWAFLSLYLTVIECGAGWLVPLTSASTSDTAHMCDVCHCLVSCGHSHPAPSHSDAGNTLAPR